MGHPGVAQEGDTGQAVSRSSVRAGGKGSGLAVVCFKAHTCAPHTPRHTPRTATATPTHPPGTRPWVPTRTRGPGAPGRPDSTPKWGRRCSWGNRTQGAGSRP